MQIDREFRLYRQLRAERLADPAVAAEYLNSVLDNSPEDYCDALENVAEAQRMMAAKG